MRAAADCGRVPLTLGPTRRPFSLETLPVADAKTLGWLLMDPSARYWFDAHNWLWIAFSTEEDGAEVADFLPPAAAFRPDLAPARKEAEALVGQGVDVRPVRVRVLC